MGKITELTTQIWEIGEQIIKENDDFRRKIKYLAQNKNRNNISYSGRERVSSLSKIKKDLWRIVKRAQQLGLKI